MRVLYLGELQPPTTSQSRFQALTALGLKVVGYDTRDVCRDPSRLVNFLGHRVYCTPKVLRANREAVRQAEEIRPDVVWIDKGRWIYPSTLRKIRALGPRLVHYNTDDIYGRERVLWLHRMGLRHYHAVLTTNRFNVREIREKFGVPCARAGMGYDPSYHHPVERATIPTADVVVIGHREPHTEAFVTALMDAKLTLRVFGGEWGAARRTSLRSVSPLAQEDYAREIVSARFALCSLSRRNRNESTGRTFEIPAIGGCLLAEDTPEHRYFFRHGEEAVLFSGTEQLVQRCREWVPLEARLDAIRHAGQERCVQMGLSWKDHLRREWDLAMRMLTDPGCRFTPADDHPMWPGFRDGLPHAEGGPP